VSRSIGLAIIGVFGWLAIAMLNVAEDVAAERYPITVRDNFGARALQTRMRVLRSAGVVVITVITVSVILMSFPSVRQLGVSLLASAGLLALVVGMAARPALENLIAGLQIALAQPIKLDDVVVIEGEWGRIEEITATYVVVRIWDSRRLLVPLGYFISHPVENWTRQTSDILGTVTMQVDYRVPVEEMRSELHTILQETPLWDQRVWNLQVTDTSQNGVELRALMSAVDSGTAWELRCHVREGLLRVVNDRWPQSLPRLRAEIEPQAGAGNGSQPQPALESLLDYRRVDEVLGDEPDLQLVGAEDVAHHEVVRAPIAVLVRDVGRAPHALDDDLVRVEEAVEHDRHFFGAVRRTLDRRDLGDVTGVGDCDTTEGLDAFAHQVDEGQLLTGVLVEQQVELVERRASHQPVVFLVEVVKDDAVRQRLVDCVDALRSRLFVETDRHRPDLTEAL
jgi:hypothetical protein